MNMTVILVLLELENLVWQKINEVFSILEESRAESKFEYANACFNTQRYSFLRNRYENRYREEAINSNPDILKQNP
jgi:hypothetical protein